jgi:hypothetical protein
MQEDQETFCQPKKSWDYEPNTQSQKLKIGERLEEYMKTIMNTGIYQDQWKDGRRIFVHFCCIFNCYCIANL